MSLFGISFFGSCLAYGDRPASKTPFQPFRTRPDFFLSGFILVAIVGNDESYVVALCEVLTMLLAHQLLAWARGHSRRLDTFLGETPQLWLGMLPHVSRDLTGPKY